MTAKNIKLVDHILVCGWSHVTADIVHQLLSGDIQEVRHIVVVDDKVERIPYHDPYVFFVHGNPASSTTLGKANAKDASSAIVLADTSLPDYNLRDSKSTLVTLALKSVNPDIYTCVELMQSENIHHLKRVNADEIICVSELSRGLIAQATVSHGLSRFISDILSFNEGSEIYKRELPGRMHEKPFRTLQMELAEYKIIALGIERSGEMHTNPGPDFCLEPLDAVLALADDETVMAEALNRLADASGH